MSDLNRKSAELESKVAILSQEIERLNGVLEKKNQEIAGMTKQLQDMSNMGITINTLQERIQKLVGENKGLGD